MSFFKIIFVVMLCLPIAYLELHFFGQLVETLARNIREKRLIRERRNEKRSVYYNGRPGRRR